MPASYTVTGTLDFDYTVRGTLEAGIGPISAVVEGQLVTSNGTTVTRDDEANYFDSDGIMQTAAAETPRTTYIDGEPLLWIDGEVTEKSGYSADLTSWDTVTTASVAKDATGLTGSSNEAFTITDDNNSVRQTLAKDYTIADDSKTQYGIFRVAKEDPASTHPLLRIEFTGGTTELAQSVVLDRSDGSTIEVDSDGAEVIVQDVGDFWHVVLSLTNNSSGNTTASLPISPSYNSDGTASEDVSAQGSIVAATAELYTDNFSFHPVLTDSGTLKIVAADVASLTNSIISGLTEGTIYAEVWNPEAEGNENRRIAQLITDGNNFIQVNRRSDGRDQASATDGGAAQANLLTTDDLTAGQLTKVAFAFKQDDFAFYRDGTQEGTDSSGTVPSFTELVIGGIKSGGAGELFGGIKTLNVHTARLSNAQLASMTT